jgi:predicted alpha/beta-hydrolase family hydrolase
MISILLTHGAGTDANSQFLIELDHALTAEGAFVRRYTLPFKQLGKTPNPKVAIEDRAGLRTELERLRSDRGGTIVAAGHSYGGRQMTMLAAEVPGVADKLVAMSYPLHPPGKPQQLRTDHFASLRTPLLILQGTRDEFGAREEFERETAQIPGPVTLQFLEGEKHSFRRSAIVTVAEAIYEFARV